MGVEPTVEVLQTSSFPLAYRDVAAGSWVILPDNHSSSNSSSLSTSLDRNSWFQVLPRVPFFTGAMTTSGGFRRLSFLTIFCALDADSAFARINSASAFFRAAVELMIAAIEPKMAPTATPIAAMSDSMHN